jgi:probable rRNA maturation factor
MSQQRTENEEIAIYVANQQSAHAVDEEQLLAAAKCVVEDAGFTSATISLAVVDDDTIQDLNKRYLDHDYATDVLSFMLEKSGAHLEGEIILSADTAARIAAEAGWSIAAEQLLYVIHGALHLVGYDDKTSAAERKMRAAESLYLARFGFERRNLADDIDEPSIVTSAAGGGIREPSR